MAYKHDGQSSVSSPQVLGCLRVSPLESPYAVEGHEQLLLIDASQGNVVIQLPPCAESTGRLIGIKVSALGATFKVHVMGHNFERIDGVGQYTMELYSAATLFSDGEGWHIIS